MAITQNSYAESMPIGAVGMPVNSEEWNTITRTAAAAISFGVPVARSGDHGCIATGELALTSVGAMAGGNTGAATITAAPAAVAPAKVGAYSLVCVLGGAGAASRWEFRDPDGNFVGIVNGATATTLGGIGPFTIADPGTDPAAGDSGSITVAAGAQGDLLGVSERCTVLGHATLPDAFAQYDNVPVRTMGVIWVTAGATVAAGDLAYWDGPTQRYTNVATDYPIAVNGRQAKFDSGAVNGGLTRLAIR